MRRPARLLHAATTTILLGLVVLQVFLAGLGVFDDPATFLTHRDLGYTLSLVVLVVLVTAILSRAGRRQIGLAALALGLLILQSVFVGVRESMPALAALHPVNGFLILLISLLMARAAWDAAREPAPAPAVPIEAGSPAA